MQLDSLDSLGNQAEVGEGGLWAGTLHVPQIAVAELRGGTQTDCLIFAKTFGYRKRDVLLCKSKIGMRALKGRIPRSPVRWSFALI